MGALHQHQDELRVATDACLNAGMRVLQLYQMGAEADHVQLLLGLMSPPDGASIVDVGCGVGEVARLMLAERPDLGFILLNLSAYQLALCPERMRRVQSDMHSMPLTAGCADVVMVNYTLGYADLDLFMAEAARVLRPGGILFIYDLTQIANCALPHPLMLEHFNYQVHYAPTIMNSAERCGMTIAPHDLTLFDASRAHLAPLLDDTYAAIMEQLDIDLMPVALRFTKAQQ